MDEVTASLDSETVKISLPWTWHPVKRRMLPGCDLFRDGDTAMQVARKLIPLEDQRDDAEQSDDKIVRETIPCSVLGCTQTFTSLLSCENHYKSAHCHSCVTCHRTLPSAFLLDVHIQENHDPLFALLAARQHRYRCLVESCGEQFPGPEDRRQHMVTVHSYPSNFRFHRLRPRQRDRPAQSDRPGDGSQLSCANNHNGHSQADPHTSTSIEAASPSCAGAVELPRDEEKAAAGVKTRGDDEGMEVLEGEEQEKPAPRRVFVHRVPQTFSFGHGVSRGFQRPPGKKKTKKKGAHWHQQGGDSAGETSVSIENVDMKDMADALGEMS